MNNIYRVLFKMYEYIKIYADYIFIAVKIKKFIFILQKLFFIAL